MERDKESIAGRLDLDINTPTRGVVFNLVRVHGNNPVPLAI